MRTTLKGILIGAVLLASAWQVFAYPPDNAAVLYYKAFMLMEEPNDALGKALAAVRKGEAKPDDQVRRYVERNRDVIKYAVVAANTSHCDWGHDLSEGLDLKVPEFTKCRALGDLLVVDARILAEQGDTKKALERCLAVHEMDRHVGNDMMIARLVGIALSGAANGCIEGILPRISDNSEMLNWLRVRLTDVSSRCPSMKEATAKEAEVCEQNINRKGIIAITEGEPCDVPKEILQRDDEFYARAREYYRSVMARMQSAFDLPYPQALQEFEDLHKEIENAVKEKPEAVVTMVLFPAIGRCCSIEARIKTHNNAILAAIDIYLIKAKTGKLPDELPAGLPKDMFSGRDFIYEKTGTGFTLKCQGRDLSFDTVRQFEFKVAK
jgi:hypothetical protein